MRRQHTRNVLGICLCLCLAGGGIAPASSSPSSLDPDFGGTGVVQTDFTGGEDGATAVTVGPGGSVIAVGFGDLGDPGRPHVAGFAVARYLDDGTPDPSFSGDGETLVDFGFVNQSAASVAVDSQGRIVTTGTITTFDGSTSSIGVTRLLADGSPDPGFGVDGEVISQPGILSAAYDVAVDDQDRVVVMGAATGARGFRPTVLRFTTEGEPDESFGDGGLAEFGKVAHDTYTTVAIDRRGRLLLGGASRPRRADRALPAVRRMSSDGTLEGGFGKGGFARPLGRIDGEVADIALDGEGRSVAVATCACGPRGDDDIGIGRSTGRGRPDATFSRDGRTYVGFGPREARASSVGIDEGGRVVTGGSVRIGGDSDWALARLRSNGKPDRAFGDEGKIAAQLGAGVEGVRGLAVDEGARVIAAGLGRGPLGSDFAVARFR